MEFRVDGKAAKAFEVKAEEDAPGRLRGQGQAQAAGRPVRRRLHQRLLVSRRPRPRPARPEPGRRVDRGRRADRQPAERPARVAQADHLPPADPATNRREVAREILETVRHPGLPPPRDPAEVDRLVGARRPGREERRAVRAGHPARRAGRPGLAPLPVPGRARDRGRDGRPEAAQRLRAGLPALVLPLVVACPTTSCSTWPRKGQLRTGDDLEAQVAPDAQGPEVAGAGRELRRPVAPDSATSSSPAPTGAGSPTSTSRSAQAMPEETELFFAAIVQEDRSDPRLPRRRLHVPQRAAGQALRDRRASPATSSAGSRSTDGRRGGRRDAWRAS